MLDIIIILVFISVGLTGSFFALVMLRRGACRYSWSWLDGLTVASSLFGGSLLAYLSAPEHFPSYATGCVLGVVSFLLYLRHQAMHHHDNL